jgi:FkbM family methyltransferase
MRAFYGQFIKPGDLVFNIGANVGIRTPVFLELGAQVVAVEPQPQMCAMLRQRCGDRATVIEAAVGPKMGEAELWLCSQDQLATCCKAWADSLDDRWPPDKWNRKITVKMITLDWMIEEYGLPDFIKIDVEGYESEVLKGLTQAPKKGLCFEFTATYLDPVMDCIDYVAGLGFDRFNYIVTENFWLRLLQWVGAEEMKMVLKGLPVSTFYGDIFAVRGE